MSETSESPFVSFVGKKQCEFCLSTKSPALQRCSNCKYVYYCNREHQKADWTKHKPLCTAATFNPKRLNKKVELQSLVRAINLVVMQVGKRWHSTYKISKVGYKRLDNVPQEYIDKIVREEEEKKNLHQSPRVEEVVDEEEANVKSLNALSIDDSKLIELLLYLEPEDPSNISIIEQWTTEAEKDFQNLPQKLTKLSLDEWQRKLLYCNRGIEVNLMIALWIEHLLNLGLPRWEVIHSKLGGERITSVHVECYSMGKSNIQTATKIVAEDQQEEGVFEFSETYFKNLEGSEEPNQLFHLVTVLEINNKEYVLDGTAFQFDIFQTVDVDGDIPFYLVPKDEFKLKWKPLKLNNSVPSDALEFLNFLKSRGKDEQGNVEENFQILLKEGFDL